jgi:rRNA maturation endonuclease Nob1
MELDLNIATLAVVTSGVGYLMVAAGVGKSMLQWRRVARQCHGCGRSIETGVCSFCNS